MRIEFIRPLAWVLLPVCIGFVFLIDQKVIRRRQGIKNSITKALRLALLFLLVLSLSGPAALLPDHRATTWAVVDLSASVAAERSHIEQALQAGLASAPKDLFTGAIAFGKQAMVDAPLAQGRANMTLHTAPGSDATDIGRALSMAAALLPEDTAGRIALISDGKDNGRGVSAQVLALAARGIPVDVLALETGFVNDAQVTSIQTPSQVYQNEHFDLIVRIDSLFETTGSLVLYANREPVATRDITLRKGENTFIFQDTAKDSGVITYEAALLAEGDENSHNNRIGAYMDVRGMPKVLIIGEETELSKILTASGMETERLMPTQIARSAEALRQYHAIALVNVNESDLHPDAVVALDDYVRKLGRGVAVFGGDDTYAIGGWRGSALEKMMPISMDVDNRLQMPSLSLVLIIDKSGSMTEGRFGISRLDMAKEAAMRSTDVLTNRDLVGVIAFDDTAKWVVPMQKVEDVAAVKEMIGTIRPGGGTAFYSALSQALLALDAANTQLKHVIFLTDGEAADSGHETLAIAMAEAGISLTTVAVGQGANTRLLSYLASLGGGRAYETLELDDIPKVFTKETYLATQAYLQNRRIFPVVNAINTLTDFDGFPALDGYHSTTAKPLSTVAMTTDRDEPLLAWWQYGAGRVITWTSDVDGAWTVDFLQWDDAPRFFAGILSFILPAEEGEGVLTVTREDDVLRMTYAIDAFQSDLTTDSFILAPDGEQMSVSLDETAPGVYEGVTPAAMEGAYAVRVEQRSGNQLIRTVESGVTVGYSKEYDLRAPDGFPLLEEIARATGGRMITDPGELFTDRGPQARVRRDLSLPLLWVALALFVLDVAQRRISWERWIKQAKPVGSEDRRQVEAKKESIVQQKKKEALKPVEPPAVQTGERLLEKRKKRLM